ncbi:hypothetical protein HYX08_00710 [Candidatus Woesearchaeota archaeon]|nr:hypothetical protein [Candidatus Woesearchaeota archaeon]
MRIEIDQSGKIEQTDMHTVVAFRNDEQYSVLLKKKIKVEILTDYRNEYKDIHYRLFAILIFYCIRNYLHKTQLIVIDIEYERRDADIKKHLITFIRKDYLDFDKNLIIFSRIGKESRAHRIAYQTLIGKLAPNKIITKNEVENLL